MNRIVLVAIGAIAMHPAGAPGSDSRADAEGIDEESVVTARRTIEQVQDAFTAEWMTIPGVEGTGIGLCAGEPCIKVYSSRGTEELRRRIPRTVEGYPVVIEETGAFRGL